MRKYPKFLIAIGFLLLVAVIFLWLSDHASGPVEGGVGDAPARDEKLSTPRGSDSASAAARVAQNSSDPFGARGTPAPFAVVARGYNQERVFSAPTQKSVLPRAKTGRARPLVMTPNDGRTWLQSSELLPFTKAARRMVFSKESVDAVIRGETARILAPLPDGSAVVLIADSIIHRSAGSTLVGKMEGEEDSSEFQLVVHDGILHGSLVRGNGSKHFDYRTLPSGYLAVREIDTTLMTDGCGGSPDPIGHSTAEDQNADYRTSGRTTSVSSFETVGFVTVDLVVGYDSSARAAAGGVASIIEGEIIAAVDRMNGALVNSQVTGTEVMLLGTIEDPDYVFPGRLTDSMNDELEDLDQTGTGNPALNTVSGYAQQLGADLKAFIVKQPHGGAAGIAYLGGSSSVTARTYMTTYDRTFEHELGHNLGCRHSWGDTASFDSAKNINAYGWRLTTTNGSKVRTIMAYDSGWGGGTRIPHFSNPNVLYGGARTGQTNGYNATGDPRSDPRYVSGGLIGTAGSGFDGSNPSLGANNASVILANAPEARNRATRLAASISSPSVGQQWFKGTSYTVSWTGGDHTYDYNFTIFRESNPGAPVVIHNGTASNRRQLVDVTSNWASGTDYRVKLELYRPDGVKTVVQSGLFSVASVAPGKVTGLRAAVRGFSSISLAWDPAEGSTLYTIRRGGNVVGTSTSPSFIDTGLDESASYSYTVQASNESGSGPNSDTASFATISWLQGNPRGLRVLSPSGLSTNNSGSIVISGQAGLQLTGAITWTNLYNRQAGSFSAGTNWSVEIPLVVGTNEIRFTGVSYVTNSTMPALDNPDDPTYSSGWAGGSGGGFGFGPWELTAAPTNNGGHFRTDIYSVTNLNTGGFSFNAFGLWANTGGKSYARRSFSSPLKSGDRFAIWLDNNWIDAGGSVGISFANAARENLSALFFAGGDQFYRVTDSISNRLTARPYTGSGFLLEFEMVSSNQYRMFVDGSEAIAGQLAATGPVENFVLFNDSSGFDTERNFYAGRMTVSSRVVSTQTAEASAPAVILSSAIDTDGDGLPDAWEVTHFGDATVAVAGTDTDVDGFNNLQEYLLGTDPNDRLSLLSVTSITRHASSLTVVWQSVVGKRYRLMSSESLVAPSWSQVGEVVVAAAQSAQQTESLGSEAPRARFYRVELVP